MKTWLLIPLVIAALVVPTGCASMRETNYFSPTSLHTSFDGVEVRNSEGRLLVKLHDMRHDLGTIQVLQATTSNADAVRNLTLLGTVYNPGSPHDVELAFAPATKPPFSLNLEAKVQGHTKILRASYYGPKSIQY